MPPQWLEGSLRAMEMMRSKCAANSGAVEIPQSLEDMVYGTQFCDDHSSQGGEGLKRAPGSSNMTSASKSTSKLESFPNSYYEKSTTVKKPKKQTLPGSSKPLSGVEARLLNSPFGDPRKILEKQRRQGDKPKSAKGHRKPPAIMETSRPDGENAMEKTGGVDTGEYPKTAKKQAIIAERLFGSTNALQTGSVEENGDSALDKLSYEEKLMVMLMQVQDESNSLSLLA